MNCFLNEVRGYADLDEGGGIQILHCGSSNNLLPGPIIRSQLPAESVQVVPHLGFWKQNVEHYICGHQSGWMSEFCQAKQTGSLIHTIVLFLTQSSVCISWQRPPPHMSTSVLTRLRRNQHTLLWRFWQEPYFLSVWSTRRWDANCTVGKNWHRRFVLQIFCIWGGKACHCTHWSWFLLNLIIADPNALTYINFLE